MLKMAHFLAVGVLAVPLATLVAEDKQDEKKPIEQQIQLKLQQVIDGIQVFGANGQFQFRARGFGGGMQISKSIVNGVTTINVVDNGKKTKIIEDPKNGITVSTTKSYDRSNADELKEKNPALFEYLKKSPQGMGEVKYNFKVEITQSYSAKDADELKNDHPEAFKLYEKYAKGQGVNVFRFNVAPQFRGALPKNFKVPNFKIEGFENQIQELEKRIQKQIQGFPRGIEKVKPPKDTPQPEPKKPGIAT
ncbi:MAG: hypothetical protein IH991_01920 [Planctomycetes bacterium]|nr:hypothetical protein [Planctomycetota bacterium]